MKNIKSTTGKVHKVIKCNALGLESDEGYRAIACDHFHNLDDKDSGWYLTMLWKKTDEDITCKNCLKSYYADGRKKV